MFSGKINPADARTRYYEQEVIGSVLPSDKDMTTAIAFLRAMEPYRESIPFGQVRSFTVPTEAEYAKRTGIGHILAVAAYPVVPDPMVPADNKAISPSALAAPLADVIDAAKKDGVRFLTIPFVGANPKDRIDIEIYDVLLQAAVDAADNPASLRSVYVGTYADSPDRQTKLQAAFNTAWQKQRLKLIARQNELVDSSWRLTSIIAFSGLLSLWVKGRFRILSAKTTIKLTVAAVLLAKGLSESLSPLIDLMARDLAAIVLFPLLIGGGIAVGWFLPAATMFDPKEVIKGMPQEGPST